MELLEALRAWGPLILAFASAVFTGLVWAMRKEFASKRDVAELEQRTALMERDIEHLPRHDHLNEVKAELGRLNANVQATGAQLQTLGNSMRRVEDYLLNRKGA